MIEAGCVKHAFTIKGRGIVLTSQTSWVVKPVIGQSVTLTDSGGKSLESKIVGLESLNVVGLPRELGIVIELADFDAHDIAAGATIFLEQTG